MATTLMIACACMSGGKFAVLGLLFSIWMVALILSRPRGGVGGSADVSMRDADGQPTGLSKDDVRPDREIVTDPRRILEIEQQRSAIRTGMVFSVTALLAVIIAIAATVLIVRHRQSMAPDVSPVESEDISMPAAPLEPAAPAKSTSDPDEF